MRSDAGPRVRAHGREQHWHDVGEARQSLRPATGAPGSFAGEVGQALPSRSVEQLLAIEVVQRDDVVRMRNHDGLLSSRRRLRVALTPGGVHSPYAAADHQTTSITHASTHAFGRRG